jgi:hypothetical protein
MPKKKISAETIVPVALLDGSASEAAAPVRARKAPAKKAAASTEPKPRARKNAPPRKKSNEAVTHRHKKPAVTKPETVVIPVETEAQVLVQPVFDPALYHEEISKQAYFCWLERGDAPGSPEGDWLRAVEIVRQRFIAGDLAP